MRTDQLKMWITGFPVSQALAVVLMAISVVLFVVRYRSEKKKGMQQTKK